MRWDFFWPKSLFRRPKYGERVIRGDFGIYCLVLARFSGELNLSRRCLTCFCLSLVCAACCYTNKIFAGKNLGQKGANLGQKNPFPNLNLVTLFCALLLIFINANMYKRWTTKCTFLWSKALSAEKATSGFVLMVC